MWNCRSYLLRFIEISIVAMELYRLIIFRKSFRTSYFTPVSFVIEPFDKYKCTAVSKSREIRTLFAFGEIFIFLFDKLNSVQEAFTKCFAVHTLKFEILQSYDKTWNKEYQILSFQFFINQSSILMLFDLIFHVVCKISNWLQFWFWEKSIT